MSMNSVIQSRKWVQPTTQTRRLKNAGLKQNHHDQVNALYTLVILAHNIAIKRYYNFWQKLSTNLSIFLSQYCIVCKNV